LHGTKAAFDLAFGLRTGGDQMSDAQKAEKARWNSERGSRSSAMESWPKRLRPSV
jgi:hypothetical protein